MFFPVGEDFVTVDLNAGPGGNGRILVGDHNPLAGPCHYRFDLLPSEHAANVRIVCDPEAGPRVEYQDGRGHGFCVARNHFDYVDSDANPCNPEEPQSAHPKQKRSAKAGPIPSPIPVSNAADAMDTTCDTRFALVVGSSDQGKPISLIDLQARTEVDTFSDPGIGTNVTTYDHPDTPLPRI